MSKYYYTYLLISSHDDRMYIGSRSSSVPPEEDTAYMSSSKAVSKEYLSNCQKFILSTFLTYKDALMHEVFLHDIYDVAKNTDFF